MSSREFFIAVVALGAIGTGTWLSFSIMSPPPTAQTATVLPAPNPIADFELVDQAGETIGRDVFEGHWNLVFFGFTHCPDICPLTLRVLSAAQATLAEDGAESLPRIVLVSVDPERDTPEILGDYLEHFGAGHLGITGSLEGVRQLTAGLGIFFQKSATSGDNYSVDHSAAVLVINPRGEFHAVFGAPHKAENYVHDMPIIMATP